MMSLHDKHGQYRIGAFPQRFNIQQQGIIPSRDDIQMIPFCRLGASIRAGQLNVSRLDCRSRGCQEDREVSLGALYCVLDPNHEKQGHFDTLSAF